MASVVWIVLVPGQPPMTVLAGPTKGEARAAARAWLGIRKKGKTAGKLPPGTKVKRA